jgi:hypothetical protein
VVAWCPATGTITFTTSDKGSGVVLPPDYAFPPSNAGSHTFRGVKLSTGYRPDSCENML